MLEFTNKPNYIYWASSTLNDKILGSLAMKLPDENYPHYTVALMMDDQILNEEEKQILSLDMIEFIDKAKEIYNKPDSI